MIYDDGSEYEGEWVNGKADGFGIFRHSDRSIYEGFWKENHQNGQGK